MKALIATDETIVGRALVKQLELLGYQCELVASGRDALAHLEKASPELVVTEWFLPDVDGTEVVREVRRKARRCTAVIVCALTEEGARIHARHCGADAYLVKPIAPDELERVAKRAGSAVGVTAPSSMTASQRAVMTSVLWQEFSREVAKMLSDFFGQQLDVTADLPGSPDNMRVVASLEMLDPTALLEVRVALGTSRATAMNLSRALSLQGEEDAALREMLAEACNVLLGRTKTAFRSLGLRFTLALPGGDGRLRADYPSQVTATLTSPGGLVRASLGARPARRVQVRCADLAPDMILVQDAMDDAGTIVVRAGARLTAQDVAKLSAMSPFRRVLVAKS